MFEIFEEAPNGPVGTPHTEHARQATCKSQGAAPKDEEPVGVVRGGRRREEPAGRGLDVGEGGPLERREVEAVQVRRRRGGHILCGVASEPRKLRGAPSVSPLCRCADVEGIETSPAHAD